MTGVRFVSMGLRFMAFWLVLLAIQSVGVVFAVQDNLEGGTSLHWWAVLPAAIFLTFAAIAWVFSLPIANKLYRGEKADETVQFSAEMLLRVGCCLLGLWMFSTALPSFARLAAIAYIRAGVDGNLIPDDLRPHTVYDLVQIAVALVLVFGNRALYHFTLGRESH